NIATLSAEYRTFAVDQVGDFGKSLCTRQTLTFDDLIAWLDELFDALELKDGVSLVGMSYGGALAAQFAMRFPERLSKLVLLAPANTILRTSIRFWMHLMAAAIARRRGLRSFIRWIFADMAREDPEWIASVLEQLSLSMQSLEGRRPVIPPVMTDAEWSSLRV